MATCIDYTMRPKRDVERAKTRSIVGVTFGVRNKRRGGIPRSRVVCACCVGLYV